MLLNHKAVKAKSSDCCSRPKLSTKRASGVFQKPTNFEGVPGVVSCQLVLTQNILLAMTRFDEFLSVILWFQTAYAVWQFVRVTKFLRLPFIFLSTIWNGWEATTVKTREYLVVDSKMLESATRWGGIDREEFDFYSAQQDTCFKASGTQYRFCGNDGSGRILRYLKCAKTMPIVKDELDLVEGVKLVKAIDYRRQLRNVVMGARIMCKTGKCIVDNTNSDGLNINFMRVISILPLVMQAKNFNTASIFVSLGIIIMDLTSVWCNMVWVLFKRSVFYWTKRGLSLLGRNPRVIIHHILATGTDSFMYCDKTMEKSYWRKLDTFICLHGCQIPLESMTEELFQPVSKEGNMVYDTVRRFRINGKDHFVETTMEEETAEGGLYTIKVTECEHSEAERMTAPLTSVHKMWRFFEILAETGTWPVTEIRGKSIHVVSPCDSIMDGTYDYAVKCTLYEEEEMFVS